MYDHPRISIRPVLLSLLLLAAPTAAQAQFDYTTNADGVSITITGYTGPGGAVTIPTNINGLTVTSIGEEAFLLYSGLTSVGIPGSVTNIGSGAFEQCKNLTNVIMDNGVTSIGTGAFGDCSFLANVVLPNGLISIGGNAFVYCASLTNVTIPDSVTNIGSAAFAASGLMSVTIPAIVSNIGSEAFGGNPDLTSVTVPGSLFSGQYDFYAVFGYGLNLKTVTIANGVTSIAEGFFGGMYGGDNQLTSVSIPASVTNIADYAFDQCFGLTNVTLSYGLSTIGEQAFFDCSHITNLTIPASVTYIGASAFSACAYMSGDFFAGNAPTVPVGSPPFNQIETIYYLPGTTGWSNTFSGQPAVLWNPQIQAGGTSFGGSNNQFGFNIAGTSDIPIVVEACTNLVGSTWTPLKKLTLTNGLVYFSEPLQTNSSGRFTASVRRKPLLPLRHWDFATLR